MSLVSFSDNSGQNSLYQNYQLQWQYLTYFKKTMQTKQPIMKKKTALISSRIPFFFVYMYCKMVCNNYFISTMLIKSLIPDFFHCLLDFPCAKYGISIVLKGHLKACTVLLGETRLKISFIFTIQVRIEQHLLSI